jgi:hypothetical protein
MSGPGFAAIIRLRFQDGNPWLALACTTYLPEQVLAYLDEVRRGHLTVSERIWRSPGLYYPSAHGMTSVLTLRGVQKAKDKPRQGIEPWTYRYHD